MDDKIKVGEGEMVARRRELQEPSRARLITCRFTDMEDRGENKRSLRVTVTNMLKPYLETDFFITILDFGAEIRDVDSSGT